VTVPRLFRVCRGLGIVMALTPDGQNVKVIASHGAVPPEVKAAIVARKPELLACLDEGNYRLAALELVLAVGDEARRMELAKLFDAELDERMAATGESAGLAAGVAYAALARAEGGANA
jgi:hypothetical protein